MIQIRLKELLEEKGISMNALSYKSSTPYSTLYRLAKSDQQRIDLDLLSRICIALQVQPGELLVEAEVKPGKKK
jgi:putative transcriptional regulator